MNGFDGFLKMQEIDKHVRQEAQWWQGEGMDLGLIATILRAVADDIDPPAKSSWAEQWEATRPRSGRAP
jgi:hypothetical protein